MTDETYKCADCGAELPHSVVALQQMINASYDLKKQINTLLEFVKWCESNSCSLIDGIDCMPCKAKEVLRKIWDEHPDQKMQKRRNEALKGK